MLLVLLGSQVLVYGSCIRILKLLAVYDSDFMFRRNGE